MVDSRRRRKPLHLRARDFLYYRTVPLYGWVKHRLLGFVQVLRIRASRRPVFLHVGSGRRPLPGWVNVDLLPLPEVDIVLDVTCGLGLFAQVRAIFAEHFLEHLEIEHAITFLIEANEVLGDDGWIRLSTPNLDWVWATQYPDAVTTEERLRAAVHANRSFYGWQHRFIWNRELLQQALAAAGFQDIRWCRYGESSLDFFRGIEQHETYVDREDLPHVLIVEAARGPAVRPDELARLQQLLAMEFLGFRAN
jgi:predicted SAM-dependent methyltransferase